MSKKQASLFSYDETYRLPDDCDALYQVDGVQAGTCGLARAPNGEEILLLLQRSWTSGGREWFSLQDNIVQVINGVPGVDSDTRIFVLDASKPTTNLYQFDWSQFTNGFAHPPQSEHGINRPQLSVRLSDARRSHDTIPSGPPTRFFDVVAHEQDAPVRECF